MTNDLTAWRALAGKRTSCAECGDARGWFEQPSDDDGEPEQVECQTCGEYRQLAAALRAACDRIEALEGALARIVAPPSPADTEGGWLISTEWLHEVEEAINQDLEDGSPSWEAIHDVLITAHRLAARPAPTPPEGA